MSLADTDARCGALRAWCDPEQENPPGSLGALLIELARDDDARVRACVATYFLWRVEFGPYALGSAPVLQHCSISDVAVVHHELATRGLPDLRGYLSVIGTLALTAEVLARQGLLDEIVLILADDPIDHVASSLVHNLPDFGHHLQRATWASIVTTIPARCDGVVRDNARAEVSRLAHRYAGPHFDSVVIEADGGRGGTEVRPEPGMDLRTWDCRGVRWAGLDLSHCDLTGVDLSRADLQRANLSGALLYRATLRAANLERVRLANAMCAGADLRQANLFAARADAATFVDADLRHANLTAARFRSVNLSRADLRGARIDGFDGYAAVFIGAEMDDPRFFLGD